MTGHFTSYENRTDHELATCPVLAVVYLDNPRDTATGQGPMAFAAFAGAPRRKAHGVCQMLYRHGWSVTL